MPIIIESAQTPADLDAARSLFREYADSLSFDLDFQGFEEELKGLPGRYADPEGIILVAWDDDSAAGCVALRPLEDGICEMKRLYVRPAYRQQGLGRALTQRLLDEARRRGYARMRLDTEASMHPARKLYRSLGFYEIDAYCHNPLEGAVYMECTLADE